MLRWTGVISANKAVIRATALWLLGCIGASGASGVMAVAQTADGASACQDVAAAPGGAVTRQLSASAWLERMRSASERYTYSGTFVVMASSGMMTVSRVWHACAKTGAVERIEALSGTPKVVYRRGQDVRVVMPLKRVVQVMPHDVPNTFPRTPEVSGLHVDGHYEAQWRKREHYAGLVVDVVDILPRDTLRFGYRVWAAQSSGLVVRWETLARDGHMLEQASFTNLQMSTPVTAPQLEAMMRDDQGYQVITQRRVRTALAEQGWRLVPPVAGFVSLGCYAGTVERADAAQGASVHCVYSDGLSVVSVFMDATGVAQPGAGRALRLGATHTLTQAVAGGGVVTVVGEVPEPTLRLFAAAAQRLT